MNTGNAKIPEPDRKLLAEALMFVYCLIEEAKPGGGWKTLWDLADRLERVICMAGEEVTEFLGEPDIIPKMQTDEQAIRKVVLSYGYDKVLNWIGENRPLGLNVFTGGKI